MNRFRTRIVVILGALVALMAAVWFLQPRSMLLFNRATRVATADDELGRRCGFYWWLSNHQVVLTRSVNGSLQSLFCHDTDTGKDDLCIPLNHLIKTQKSAARIEALSSDRRVLLFRNGRDRQLGVTLDGRLLFSDLQTASTPNTEPASESYMAAGSRWVEPIYAWPSQERVIGDYHIARLLIHDGTQHKIVKTVTFSPWLEHGFPDTLTSRNHLLMLKRPTSVGFGSPPCLQTIDIDLNASAPTPQTLTLTLKLPSTLFPFTDLYDICYSPDGERVAFLYVLDNRQVGWLPPFLQGWWDRLFPHNPTTPYKVSLWVSDIHGQRMHKVGEVPHVGNVFSSVDENYPSSVQWLPDGKTLSFLAHGSVWTVPAD